jgi:hypothetical protein
MSTLSAVSDTLRENPIQSVIFALILSAVAVLMPLSLVLLVQGVTEINEPLWVGIIVLGSAIAVFWTVAEPTHRLITEDD